MIKYSLTKFYLILSQVFCQELLLMKSSVRITSLAFIILSPPLVSTILRALTITVGRELAWYIPILIFQLGKIFLRTIQVKNWSNFSTSGFRSVWIRMASLSPA